MIKMTLDQLSDATNSSMDSVESVLQFLNSTGCLDYHVEDGVYIITNNLKRLNTNSGKHPIADFNIFSYDDDTIVDADHEINQR